MSDDAKAAFRAAVREVDLINQEAIQRRLGRAEAVIEYFIACRRVQGWRLVSPGTSDEPSLWMALEKARAYMADKDQKA